MNLYLVGTRDDLQEIPEGESTWEVISTRFFRPYHLQSAGTLEGVDIVNVRVDNVDQFAVIQPAKRFSNGSRIALPSSAPKAKWSVTVRAQGPRRVRLWLDDLPFD